jgi:glucokinase
MILAGDIGGTSTRLALFDVQNGHLALRVELKYPSRDHKGLDEIVAAFVAAHKACLFDTPIGHAAFGIAGPIREGRVHPSNLPWLVDATALAAQLHIPTVYLINDLEANAHGIAELKAADFFELNKGVADPHGNSAIISAGTGLGEAGIYFDGRALRPFPCEGGHCDFSPRNQLEVELLLYLKEKLAADSAGHVSCERVLSGPGLKNIYDFLHDTGRGKEGAVIAAQMQSADASAVISKAALAGKCPLCVQALEMFVAFYGAESGNLALKMLATRGIYVGGGIAPKILPMLKRPIFMEAFASKGRMRAVLEKIPVHVILNDQTALLGAARFAAVKANLFGPWTGVV